LDSFTDYYCQELKRCNAQEVLAKGIPLHEIDLATDSLDKVLDQVEVIYHLAAQPGISSTTSFETYVRNNIVATHKLLLASQEIKTIRCFVNVSTSSVYGKHATDSEESAAQPTSYYGVTKLAAEQLVLSFQRDKDFPTCSLRLFSVYGPRERPEKLYPKLIHSILSGTECVLFEGSRRHSRSFTFIDDILAGFLAILNHIEIAIGEIFNIGSDIELTTGEAIEIVERLMGRKARFKLLPPRPGDQLRTHANIDKARSLLGYQPITRPEVGFQSEIDWYKDKIYGKVHVY